MGSSPVNFPDVLRVQSEADHTHVLAWLLDPREGHGFGDAITREFHRLVLGRVPEQLTEAVVSVEHRLRSNHLDILVHAHGDCLVVENRLHAGAWTEDEPVAHRESGGPSSPASRTHRVILESLESDRGKRNEEGSRRPGRTVRWGEIVAALDAAYDHVRKHRPHAAGLPFLRAYVELVEQSVIGRWHGFKMDALQPRRIGAATRYLTCKPDLLEELQQFCEAVQSEVGGQRGWVARGGTEVQWDNGVILHALYYEPAVTATAGLLCVSLCFWTFRSRPDHLELWLGTDTSDTRLLDRWDRALKGTGVKQLFGPRALFSQAEGHAEVCELIPRKCWHVSTAAQGRRAITYCSQRVLHYLEVSSRAPVSLQRRPRNDRRSDRAFRAA